MILRLLEFASEQCSFDTFLTAGRMVEVGSAASDRLGWNGDDRSNPYPNSCHMTNNDSFPANIHVFLRRIAIELIEERLDPREMGNFPRSVVEGLQPRDEELQHLEFYIERKLDEWVGYCANVRVAVWEDDLFDHFMNIYSEAALAMWEERSAAGR